MRHAAFFALLSPLLLCGCGTIANGSMPWLTQTSSPVYGGTMYDVAAAKAHFGAAFGPKSVGPDFRDLAFLLAVAHVADVPLSAAADTVCLPFTLVASMRVATPPETAPTDVGR